MDLTGIRNMKSSNEEKIKTLKKLGVDTRKKKY